MTIDGDQRIGGLLLAAGGSSRMGRPKQLVEFEGKTLIRRAAENLAGSGCSPSVVVLGAEIDGSLAEIEGLPLRVCVNKDWATGMSSSIRAGLAAVTEIDPLVDAVLITLCDQPYIESADLVRLINVFKRGGSDIVAAEYNNIAGVPAIFSSTLFADLLELQGDKGARDIIRSAQGSITTFEMPSASFDLDEPPQG